MTKMDCFVVVVAQHAAPLQGDSINLKTLFDNDAHEFLLADADFVFCFFGEIDARGGLGHDFAVDLESFLLDEPLRFGGGRNLPE
jgi:hypothetical protein